MLQISMGFVPRKTLGNSGLQKVFATSLDAPDALLKGCPHCLHSQPESLLCLVQGLSFGTTISRMKILTPITISNQPITFFTHQEPISLFQHI